MSRTRELPKQPSWIRDFRLLMVGSFVSMLGSRISTIAFPLLALSLTNSPFDAGLVAFAATIPSALVYIPAGALVDRWDPRRAMLICEFGRGVAVAVVTASLAIGKPSIFLLIPIVIVEEILEVFSTLADRRWVRDLVPRDRASSTQARIETKTQLVVLMGRPLGGFLFALMPIFPFLADAASFVFSVLSIVNLGHRPATKAASSRISGKQLGEDIITALKVLLDDGYARAALTFSSATTLIGQALIMIFLANARTSGLSSAGTGLVLAASGIGGVLGAASAPLFRKSRKASLVLFQMVAWAAALSFLTAWGWRSFYCMAVVMAMLSLTGALGNIEIDTYLVQSFNENMLARVTSFGRLIAFSASAVGPILGGMLVQLYKTHNAMVVLLAITLVLAILAGLTPSMRNRRAAVRPATAVLRQLRESAASLCRRTAGPLMATAAVLALRKMSAACSWRLPRQSLASLSSAHTGSSTGAQATALSLQLGGASSIMGISAGTVYSDNSELRGHLVTRLTDSHHAGHRLTLWAGPTRAEPGPLLAGASPTARYRWRQTLSDTKTHRPLTSSRPRQEAFPGAFTHAFANAVGAPGTGWQFANGPAVISLVSNISIDPSPSVARRAHALAVLSPWLDSGTRDIWSESTVVPALLAGMQNRNQPLTATMDMLNEIANPPDLQTVRYAHPASLSGDVGRMIKLLRLLVYAQGAGLPWEEIWSWWPPLCLQDPHSSLAQPPCWTLIPSVPWSLASGPL